MQYAKLKRASFASLMLLTSFLPLQYISAAKLSVRLRVLASATGKPIADSQVILLRTGQKAFTDENGYALLHVPRTGYYTFRIITPAGELTQPRFRIAISGQTIESYVGKKRRTPDVSKNSSNSRSGIRVQGQKDRTPLSRYRLRIDEIKRMPGMFGEALRSVETLPGVSSPAFGFGQLFIRGANPNSNFYFLDDLPVGYAFHMLGFNSVINNDFIKTMEVYTGNYPVKYGDATGGIIVMESIDEVDSFGGIASFSVLSANALLKGRIGKNGYWVAAGRGSYMEKTLKPLIPDGIRPPRYGDAQLKIHYRINPRNSFTIMAFGAKDTVGIEVRKQQAWDPTTEPDPIFVGARLSNSIAFNTEAITYEWRPGTKLSNQLTAYYHDNIFFLDGKLGNLQARQTIQDGYSSVRNVTRWDVLKRHIFIEAGIEGRVFLYRLSGTAIRPRAPEDISPDFFDDVNQAFETVPADDSSRTIYNSGYLNAVIKGGGFVFNPGIRGDYFGLTGQRTISPRGTLSRYFKSTGISLTIGSGLYYRTPDPDQYSPSAGNPNLRMERSEHHGVGIEKKMKSWLFRVEGFRHNFSDIVVADVYATTIGRLNQNPDLNKRYADPVLEDDPLSYSNDGTGYSQGYEMYIKRTLPRGREGLFGWLSYTWSRTYRNDHQHVIDEEEKKLLLTEDERKILNQYDNAKTLYADFDRTVVANLVLGYRISEEWQFGLRWKYSSSPPYTPIIGDDGGRQRNGSRIIFDPEYSKDRNSKRLGAYHRLDIRVDRFLGYAWGYGNVFFEAINVYVRKNRERLDFNSNRPFARNNPEPAQIFEYLNLPAGRGQSYRIPFINFGIEMKWN